MPSTQSLRRPSLAHLAPVVLLALTSAASAIIIRHDTPDAQYVCDEGAFPFVVTLGGGTGTLIHERWILTAAHVATGLSGFSRSVEIAGGPYTIDLIVPHPEWRGGPGPRSVDMSLVRLTAPARDVAIARLYANDDEVGQTITLVGRGVTGNGRTGPRGEDGKLRAATNNVEEVRDPHKLLFTFDEPPGGTALEGVSGGGDSGGPALIDVGASDWRVAGVSSAGMGRGQGPGRYGQVEHYTRVSTNADWIRRIIDERTDEPAQAQNEPIDLEQRAWPDTPAASVARAFFEAFGLSELDAMIEFETAHRGPRALQERSADARARRWMDDLANWGVQTPVRCIAHSPLDIEVLARDPEAQQWRTFRFRLNPGEPPKLMGVWIGRAPRPDN